MNQDNPLQADASTLNQILTVGHSDRSWGEFAVLLIDNRVERLADVRSYPNSRRYPQYNRANIASGLLEFGIQYEHFPELGGMRTTGITPSPNSALRAGGFRNYADHMLSSEFRLAVYRLLAGAGRRTALLCAEANPAQCHRGLLSDYLVLAEKMVVLHILGKDRVKEHVPHSRARLEHGQLLYPPLQGELF